MCSLERANVNPPIVGAVGTSWVAAQVYHRGPIGVVDKLQVGEGVGDEANGSNDNGEDTISTLNSFEGRYLEVWIELEDRGTQGNNVNPLPIAPDQPQSEDFEMFGPSHMAKDFARAIGDAPLPDVGGHFDTPHDTVPKAHLGIDCFSPWTIVRGYPNAKLCSI